MLNQGSPTILQNPIVPIKKVVTYALPNTLISGDSITGTIDGQAVNVSFSVSDANTLATLTTQIDGLAGVDATFDTPTRTLTVTAATAGVTFAHTDLAVNGLAVTSVNLANNQTEVRAARSLVLLGTPLENETIDIGQCNITFMSGASDYDCSDSASLVDIGGGNLNTIAALLRGISGISDTANGVLSSSGTGSSVIFTRATSQSGTTAILFADGTTPGTLSTSSTAPVVAVAQSDSYTVPRTLVDGDSVNVTVDGTNYSQTFITSTDTTVSNLATNINNLPYLIATASGNTITLESETAGNPYTTGNLTVSHTSNANQTIANTVGAKALQSIVFGSGFVTGDVIDVTVNSAPTSTAFTTDSTTTLLNIASAISGISGVSATASGADTILITTTATGSSLIVNKAEVKNISAPSVVQANIVAVAQSNSYIIQYPLVTGNVVTGTINGTPTSQNQTTDNTATFTLLAGKLEGIAPINASFSGGSQTLTISAKNPGTAYTSSILVTGETVAPVNQTPNVNSGSQVESYTFSRNIVTGEVLNVTLNGSGVTQNFTTDSATTLAALATKIDALAGVTATPAGSTIIVTAEVAGIPFTAGTLTIDMSVTDTLVTPNVPAQTQIETIAAPRNLVSGDVI